VLGRMKTKAKILLACRSTTTAGTPGRMKLWTDSDCETVFACPDYDDDGSTFDDGINVPGLADASNHREKSKNPGTDFSKVLSM